MLPDPTSELRSGRHFSAGQLTDQVTQLDQPKDHCDACNRHKQHCYNQVALGGFPYDKDSHQMVDDSDSDDEELDPMHMGWYWSPASNCATS